MFEDRPRALRRAAVVGLALSWLASVPMVAAPGPRHGARTPAGRVDADAVDTPRSDTDRTEAAAREPRYVRSSASSLVLRQEDLPLPFAIAGGDDQPDGQYVAIFFRPEILQPAELVEGDLMGVIAAVAVAADLPEAREAFASRTTADSLGEGPAGADTVLTAEDELEAKLMGIDEALLFRVEYRLQGVHVIEYRYRMRLANAVANVLVSGRAGRGGVEPEALAGQARRIAERQAARLAAARRP